MAERPRELDQRFQMGGSILGYYRLRSYFSRHCDTTQFTLMQRDRASSINDFRWGGGQFEAIID